MRSGPCGGPTIGSGGAPTVGHPPQRDRVGSRSALEVGPSGPIGTVRGCLQHRAAVGTTEDGQVANQFDVEAVCVLPQCLPLAIQDPLHKGVVFRLG